jgi:hypothetical protein
VEWDTPVTGLFETQSDGTLYLQVSATNNTGPPSLTTYTSPGCTPQAPTTSTGRIWTGVGGYLTNGRYDLRQDDPLGTDETGQHYYEVHLQQTNH